MGIEVQLRREDGAVIETVGDPQMVLSRAAQRAFSGTHLLRYLVPWGDAVFNQAQASDLAADILLVRNANAGTPLSQLLSEIEPLVERLSRETQLYLWFVGD
jgi:hypothetical protein